MTSAPPIDFAAVAARADLRALVEADLGPADRSRRWRCPFHADHRPSLSITPDGRRFKCWSGRCGATGTALDWVMLRDRVSVVEAARKLDPSIGDDAPARRTKPAPRPAPPLQVLAPAPPSAPAWHDPAWQATVSGLIEQAEAILWGAEGRPFLGWLRGRGLDDGTIRRFRLGALPVPVTSAPLVALSGPDGRPRPIRAERGILIPWVAPGPCYASDAAQWCGANIRRLMPDVAEPWTGPDKCRALRGSERGHLYPWADVLPSEGFPPALLVEGELDALVGWQEAGWLALAGTVGGATQTPRPSALSVLARCPWWLMSFDHDEAGVEAAKTWRGRAPHKARRVLLPHGKDLSDFHAAGGDIAGWLSGELARLEITGG
jgi:DNA primase